MKHRSSVKYFSKFKRVLQKKYVLFIVFVIAGISAILIILDMIRVGRESGETGSVTGVLHLFREDTEDTGVEYADGTVFFIDDISGDDTNDGLTVDSAWLTVGKVNSVDFTDNSIIKFKRGGVWDETLTLESITGENKTVTIDAYGLGIRPKFYGAGAIPADIDNVSIGTIVIRDIQWTGTTLEVETYDIPGAWMISGIANVIIDHVKADGLSGPDYGFGSGLFLMDCTGRIEIMESEITGWGPQSGIGLCGFPDAHGIHIVFSAEKKPGTILIHDNSAYNNSTDNIKIVYSAHKKGSLSEIYNNSFDGAGASNITLKSPSEFKIYRNVFFRHNRLPEFASEPIYPLLRIIGNETRLYPAKGDIYDNYFQENSGRLTDNEWGAGVYIADGYDIDIRQNKFGDVCPAIWIRGNDISSAIRAYANIAYSTRDFGKCYIESCADIENKFCSVVLLEGENLTNLSLLNNSFYSGGKGVINGIRLEGDTTGDFTIKNNLIELSGSELVYPLLISPGSRAGIDSDYNIFFSRQPGRVNDRGNVITGFNFTEWTQAHPDDISADPLFSGAEDLNPLPGSPAVDSGTDLGETYDFGLNPLSLWTREVETLKQSDHGSGWERGAYVHIDFRQ